MIVLAACEQSESEHSVSADGVIGNHSLNGKLHSLFGFGCHKSFVIGFLEVADIAGVALPLFLLKLFAGENGVLAVDDDNVISAVNVRGKG